MSPTNFRLLIIEPDVDLTQPYTWFPQIMPEAEIIRVPTVELAFDHLQPQPDLVCLSTSFSPLKVVKLLEALKQASTAKVIPLIFVVHWQNRLTTIPGTTWGGRIGLLHSLSSVAEVRSTLERVNA